MGYSKKARTFAWIWTLAWAITFIILEINSISLCDGHFIYPIDDTYIHLSLAENIANGAYGVNSSEFSSPSSSILYPLLLAATELLGFGYYGPFVINAVAAGLSVWLLLEFFWRYSVPEGIPIWSIFPNATAPLLILSISAVALPMLGMEHSLHVLTVLLTFRGLVAVAEGVKTPFWLVLALIAMPLVRFEGMALAGAASLALVLLGRWRSGVAVSVAIIACFSLYGFVMHQLGLPILPSSVMSKSRIAANLAGDTATLVRGGGGIRGLLHQIFWQTLSFERWGVIFGLVICVLMISARNPQGHIRPVASPGFIIGGVMALALGAHLVAGRYGWFFRYEVYAVAICIVGGIYLLRNTLQNLMKAPFIVPKLGVVGFLVIIDLQYVNATLVSPSAARSVYDQQYQMHRFATEYFPHAVAVQDLGWTSYRNENYVLDLAGLGSESVRKLRVNRMFNSESVSAMVAKSSVDFAMIYDQGIIWRSVPKNWCRMAILKTKRVTQGGSTVQFLATNRAIIDEMRAALEKFRLSLPKGVVLDFYPCESKES